MYKFKYNLDSIKLWGLTQYENTGVQIPQYFKEENSQIYDKKDAIIRKEHLILYLDEASLLIDKFMKELYRITKEDEQFENINKICRDRMLSIKVSLCVPNVRNIDKNSGFINIVNGNSNTFSFI